MNLDLEAITASALQHLPEPYFSTANLTLTFAIGDGNFVIDDIGNPIESVSNTVIECSVSEDKDAQKFKEAGEIGQTVLHLKGRCLNPKKLPTAIALTMTATAVLTNPDDTTITGIWRFTSVPQNRIAAYVDTRGSFVKGTITLPAKT